MMFAMRVFDALGVVRDGDMLTAVTSTRDRERVGGKQEKTCSKSSADGDYNEKNSMLEKIVRGKRKSLRGWTAEDRTPCSWPPLSLTGCRVTFALPNDDVRSHKTGHLSSILPQTYNGY